VGVAKRYGSAPAFSFTLVIVSSQPFLSPALSCARAFSMRSRASFTPAAVDLAFGSVGFTPGDASSAFGELDEVEPARRLLACDLLSPSAIEPAFNRCDLFRAGRGESRSAGHKSHCRERDHQKVAHQVSS
jgi:hypothetical protein